MKDSWHNNMISKKLNEEYPHDFSICDIDGVCRYNKPDPDDKMRFIWYESKIGDEKASKTQLETLYKTKEALKWEQFDDKSGICLIRHDPDCNYLTFYKIVYDDSRYPFCFYETREVTTSTFKEFYNLISGKPSELDDYFGEQSFT